MVDKVRTVGTVKTVGTPRQPYARNIHNRSDDPFYNKDVSPVRPLNRHLARALERRMGHNSEQCDEVSSTAVNAIGYNNAVGMLSVTFKQGRTYNYYDVSGPTYRAFCEAESKGRFFNQNIRNKYAYTRLG